MVRNAECKKYLTPTVRGCTHSVHGRPHVVLTILEHELLFISLDFMVQNDYEFRRCMMNILTRL